MHAHGEQERRFHCVEAGKQRLYLADCLQWIEQARKNSISGIVTDPPYALIEYEPMEQQKLRSGRGGVWRIPPTFDGSHRKALPRFAVLTGTDRKNVAIFFEAWGRAISRILKPGAHLFVASNPTMCFLVGSALEKAGFESRGIIARLVRTFRGGDRPKNAELEFSSLSTMPRSCWEPWLLFRKPIECRTVADNLRKYGTGALRRRSKDTPFLDVIRSGTTPDDERAIAPHPSLKPQQFLRQLVTAVLPLGKGIVLDSFAGSGSTLAACEAMGLRGVGIERDQTYFDLASTSIAKLSALRAAPIHLLQTFLPGL